MDRSKIRGPRIKTINIVSLVLTVLILLLFLASIKSAIRASDELDKSTELFVESEMAANALKQGSDNLTTQVRLYSVTGKEEYLRAYFAEVASKNREEAVETLRRNLSDTEAYDYLDDALDCSLELMQLEYYAMTLVLEATGGKIEPGMEELSGIKLRPEDRALSASEKMALASELMHGTEYRSYDETIDEDVAKCLENVRLRREIAQEENTQALWYARTRQVTLAILLAAIVVIKTIITTVYVVRPIEKDIDFIAEDKELPLEGAYEVQYFAESYNQVNAQRKESGRKKLQAALEKAEAANRAKSTFLMSMSHDLRTPMNAISGFTALAEAHAEDPAAVRDHIKKISVANDHLVSLIDGVLEMSRLESSEIELNEQECSLKDILYEVETIVLQEISEKKMDFALDTSGVTDDHFVCDRGKLSRILLNVLGNSVKFTPEGGRIRLEVHETKGEGVDSAEYEFKISDTGVGMSKEFQEHLFEAFAREQTSTASGIQGTGLGMAVTKSFVDLMQGEIFVESEEGKGTTITVTLPLRLVSSEGEDLEGDSDAAAEDSPSERRILIVDDIEINRELAAALLEEAGFSVEEADDGSTAVAKIQNSEAGYYDLVLMDIQMPIMDGYEATRKIRAMEPPKCEIPIIALSANALAEDRKNSAEAGMNDHVGKPFNLGELIEVMQKYIK